MTITGTKHTGSRIGFGGGCHWCTEAVFQSLRGVSSVEQGWISPEAEPHAFSEAVIVHFDEQQITLETLIEIHLRTHSSTSRHRMRKKYRSAVYAFDLFQLARSQRALGELQSEFEKPLITQSILFGKFKLNDEKYLNYYQENSERAFCKTYIDPKLRVLRERYTEHVGDLR